ncbi:MAG: hypothetical protein ACR2LL_08740 [Nitrosopumilus sp.]
MLDGYFIYILSDTTPIPNPPDWFRSFANSLLRGKFWLESNNDDTLYSRVLKDIEKYRDHRFRQPKAETRLV